MPGGIYLLAIGTKPKFRTIEQHYSDTLVGAPSRTQLMTSQKRIQITAERFWCIESEKNFFQAKNIIQVLTAQLQ